MSAPSSDTEWSYTLPAILASFPIAVVIDNVRTLESRELAKVLTDDSLVSRMVKTSTARHTPIRCAWIATGNNPTIHQEIRRRIVAIHLDAGMEEPWVGRTFKIRDLKAWLREHRSSMVWACLVLVRHWYAEGKPQGTLTLGMYESWSHVMGGILGAAELHGLLEKPVPAATDMQSVAERWFIETMFEQHGVESVSASDIVAWAADDGTPLRELWGTSAKPDSYTTRLGLLMQNLQNKRYTFDTGTLRLVNKGQDTKTRRTQYALVKVRRTC
jgi:hypothetical protein